MTFELAIKDYLEHLQEEDRSPNSIHSEKHKLFYCTKVLEKEFRVSYVHKLTEEQAYQFRRYLLKRVEAEEIKRISAFNKLNSIKRLFKWLKKRKLIPENPWLELMPLPFQRRNGQGILFHQLIFFLSCCLPIIRIILTSL